ncbi:MAG: hypothetical protein ACM3S1_00645, partial [Hyphomicrobiales bacterium]
MPLAKLWNHDSAGHRFAAIATEQPQLPGSPETEPMPLQEWPERMAITEAKTAALRHRSTDAS